MKHPREPRNNAGFLLTFSVFWCIILDMEKYEHVRTFDVGFCDVDFKDELKQIASVLERHQIPYIPLKGSVLCEDYPKAWMRSRRDIDILVSSENHQKACDALCEELKYSFFRENKNDRVFTTRNQLTVEVHHQLISDDYIPQAMSFLDSVWKKSSPVSAGGYCFRMDSDMYIYHHIAHMAKHFYEIFSCKDSIFPVNRQRKKEKFCAKARKQ